MRRSSLPRAGFTVAMVALSLAIGMTSIAAERLVLWHWEQLEWMQQLFEEAARSFELANPGVAVEVNLVPKAEYFDKLVVGFASNVVPDIVLMDPRYDMMSTSVFIPLNAFVERDGFDTKDFFPPTLETWTLKGDLLALPRSNATQTLFFNKDLFDASGLTYPSTLHRASEWDFNALLEAARKMTRDHNNDGQPDQLGIERQSFTYDRGIFSYVWLNNGDFFSKDRARVVADQPKTRETLEFLIELNRTGSGPGGGQKLFEAGSQGIWRQWLDRIGIYKVAPPIFRWDVAPLPSNGGDTHVYLNGPAWAIVKGSRNPDLAWRLLKHLSSRETHLRMVSAGIDPVRISVARSNVWLRNGVVENLDIAYNERAVRGGPVPVHYPGISEAWGKLIPALSEIQAERKPIESALAEAIPPAQAVLNEIRAKAGLGTVGK